jgi:pyruvate formate lyase activating enzyme
LKGIIFNIQRYSLEDGPGIRTTVFLKGCPLKCLWCSNPESQNNKPEIVHRNSSCNKCGKCIEACSEKAFILDDSGIKINRELCTTCGKCINVCLPDALKLFGTYMSVDDVMLEIKKDVQYYQGSNGGVTLSGGEPLAQPDFAGELIKKCKSEGIHTCIETCGLVSPTVFDTILQDVSLVLFDVKVIDSIAHEKLTSKSNEIIMQNLEHIAISGTPVIIRVPLIPELNDSEDQLKAIAQNASNLGQKRIHILPYHKFGTGKYQQLDRSYTLNNLNRPDANKLQSAKEIMESYGINCEIIG